MAMWLKVKRRVWQRLLWWRFWLWQRHRHNQLVLETAVAYPLLVLPSVLNPVLFRTGEFLGQALDDRLIPPATAVLDMGTGTGIGAICAARWASRVVAVDINPTAVRCAQINCLLNHVEDKVHVCQGDLFAPVAGQAFDVVLFNPPYYRGQPHTWLDHAFYATDVVERFTQQLTGHLKPGGYALVLLSSQGDEATFLAYFQQHRFTTEAVRQHDFYNEQLTLYRLRPL